MGREIAVLFVQDDEPSGFLNTDPNLPNAIWIKKSTGEIYNVNVSTGAWEKYSIPVHSDFNLDLTEDHIKLTHLRIVNGIVTELTYQ